jgi:hypothetical protein
MVAEIAANMAYVYTMATMGKKLLSYIYIATGRRYRG